MSEAQNRSRVPNARVFCIKIKVIGLSISFSAIRWFADFCTIWLPWHGWIFVTHIFIRLPWLLVIDSMLVLWTDNAGDFAEWKTPYVLRMTPTFSGCSPAEARLTVLSSLKQSSLKGILLFWNNFPPQVQEFEDWQATSWYLPDESRPHPTPVVFAYLEEYYRNSYCFALLDWFGLYTHLILPPATLFENVMS